MFETINLNLFNLINASSTPDPITVRVAQISAEWLLYLVAVAMVIGWIRGGKTMRRALLVSGMSVLVGLAINQLIGAFWYHPRPFETGVGNQFLPHAKETSFPSDHGTLLFAVSFGLLFSRDGKSWGVIAFAIALLVVWSRIYLGIHWPMDMIGSGIIAAVAAWIVAVLLTGPVDWLLGLVTRVYDSTLGRFI